MMTVTASLFALGSGLVLWRSGCEGLASTLLISVGVLGLVSAFVLWLGIGEGDED